MRSRPLPAVTRFLGIAVVAALATSAAEAADPAPKAGGWATYRWSSSISQEYPVLVQQPAGSGQPAVSLARESSEPPPLFVTYAIVRSEPRTYVLQITTHVTADAPPLSITQVTVDRRSGKALRAVIQRPQGLIATPESGMRPFREADAKGAEEPVAVPAGRFQAKRTSYENGTAWVSDQVPALGLVKAVFPNGTLELVKSGTTGARDLLRS